jgi:hypothetical protein
VEEESYLDLRGKAEAIFCSQLQFHEHRLLHPPTGGLLIYFLPVEENKLITLHRSVHYSAFFSKMSYIRSWKLQQRITLST